MNRYCQTAPKFFYIYIYIYSFLYNIKPGRVVTHRWTVPFRSLPSDSCPAVLWPNPNPPLLPCANSNHLINMFDWYIGQWQLGRAAWFHLKCQAAVPGTWSWPQLKAELQRHKVQYRYVRPCAWWSDHYPLCPSQSVHLPLLLPPLPRFWLIHPCCAMLSSSWPPWSETW